MLLTPEHLEFYEDPYLTKPLDLKLNVSDIEIVDLGVEVSSFSFLKVMCFHQDTRFVYFLGVYVDQ